VTGWDEGPQSGSPPAELTPNLLRRIGRRLHDLASREDCTHGQDIADAANALLGREPDPGSPWDGRPLPAEPDTALRERIALALETHQIEWIDHEVGFECGCNEHGQLGALPRLVDTLRHQADAVMEVLSAAPPEREASCTCDGGPQLGIEGDPHCDYCETNHPHHPCDERSCRFAEREAPTPASVRAAALRRIEQREATPGNPADGPSPASVGEVADELAGLVVELDAGPARGLVRELAARLPEREAPSREEAEQTVAVAMDLVDLAHADPGSKRYARAAVTSMIECGWLQVREGGQR
jgi:hypothetical protein